MKWETWVSNVCIVCEDVITVDQMMKTMGFFRGIFQVIELMKVEEEDKELE